MVANPSHLEAVDPVLEGIVRAKQDRLDLGLHGYTVLPVLVHGDAAFAGQGVVAETLNLSQLRGYRTGGTVHVVVNNQVGFTTAPEYSRSSLYSTDVARMIQAPIFHVNGDDPEAVVRVAKLAFEYRQAFNKDVVIDLVCYRRRGHNEGDDPSMTNPRMYQIIDTKRSVRKLYTEELIGRGDITVDDAQEQLRDYQSQLEQVFKATRDAAGAPPRPRSIAEEPEPQVETAIDAAVVRAVGQAHLELPEGFTPHKRVQQLLERRAKMAADGGIDWGFGELIAFGSLLSQGVTVRLAGQDSRRGTFVSRHASIVDAKTGKDFLPLSTLATGNARFFVHDSLLSEYAAMGFEYGYSVENPDALVLWEAQFGDFANGAQSIVDEFISSGEVKWGQQSSLVLLLPHGQEGQGPDHSSGRPERFLQLCAQDNMRVANPTTPANYFHLLRRQALSSKRKPLVVFSPKSLLRHKLAVSSVADFTPGTFQPVLGDAGVNGTPLDAGCGQAGAALLGQGLLRPVPGPGRARHHRHRDHPDGADLPAAGGRAQGGAGAVPERRGLRLGAGGAGQPGRLVVRGAQPARAPGGRTPAADLPPGRRRSGGRLGQDARRRAGGAGRGRRCRARNRSDRTGGAPLRRGAPCYDPRIMYFTDRGIEELVERRGEETVTLEWLGEQLRTFVDMNPEFETPIERFATWLARDDEDDED